jgi:hypothetical protein
MDDCQTPIAYRQTYRPIPIQIRFLRLEFSARVSGVPRRLLGGWAWT